MGGSEGECKNTQIFYVQRNMGNDNVAFAHVINVAPMHHVSVALTR